MLPAEGTIGVAVPIVDNFLWSDRDRGYLPIVAIADVE
jgi:hypothetical protein